MWDSHQPSIKERIKLAEKMKRKPETPLKLVKPENGPPRPSWMTRVYKNNRYIVMIDDYRKTTHGYATCAMIQAIDDKPIQNHWSEIQRIKNAIFGKEAMGIEYYPAQSKLTNDHKFNRKIPQKMRIDKERFPALFDHAIVLKNYAGILDQVTMDKMASMVVIADTVRTYLSKPVIDPMLTSYKKLVPHRKELTDSCRSLIYMSKAGNPHVLHYVMLVENDRINIHGQTHFIMPNKPAFGMLFSVFVDRLENDLLHFRSYPDIPPILNIQTHDEILNVVLYTILSAELFINFAEVETKVMQPNCKIWDERGVNAIYNNKTNADITIIDSTWYTNLVSSGAFNVRGHFRLQPYGPERSQRRLQWIADFQKEGYHRKAKKLETDEKET